MEQGPGERKIIETCLRERLPFPKRIENAPELCLGLELFYSAWCDLDTDRPVGWNARPIPWTAMRDYADAYSITGEQREDLFYFVRAMDKAYLKYVDSKAKKSK